MKTILLIVLIIPILTTTVFAVDLSYFNQAREYELSGDYSKAVDAYRKYIPIAHEANDIFRGVYSQMKIRLLTPIFSVYNENYTHPSPHYTGAKFEPKRGMYFGSVYNDNHYEFYPKKQSIRLMYCEFAYEQAYETLGWHKDLDDKTAIIFAWNTYTTMPDVEQYEDYINESLDFLNSLNRPVYLRIANEMNIGPNGGDIHTFSLDETANAANEYIRSFRYIAERAKQRENIAVVWSPNDVGSIIRPFDLYYPGDDVVDWIGISHYNIKRFRIDLPQWQQEELNTSFITGNWANPIHRVMSIVDFMRENNIDKPLMITEGGVEHIRKRQNEDSTEWALRQLNLMYEELPRYYPELKAASYFNVTIAGENEDFALNTNAELTEAYHNAVDNPYFISNYGDNAPFWYEEFFGGEFSEYQKLNLSAIAYYPNASNLAVVYRINDEEVYYGETSPYKHEIDLSMLGPGKHRIDLVLFVNWELHYKAERWINVIEDSGQLRMQYLN